MLGMLLQGICPAWGYVLPRCVLMPQIVFTTQVTDSFTLGIDNVLGGSAPNIDSMIAARNKTESTSKHANNDINSHTSIHTLRERKIGLSIARSTVPGVSMCVHVKEDTPVPMHEDNSPFEHECPEMRVQVCGVEGPRYQPSNLSVIFQEQPKQAAWTNGAT